MSLEVLSLQSDELPYGFNELIESLETHFGELPKGFTDLILAARKKEGEIQPNVALSLEEQGDSIDDYISVGLLEDTGDPLSHLPQFGKRHYSSEEIFAGLGFGVSWRKHVYESGRKIMINRGKYAQPSLRYDENRSLIWLQKTYSTIFHHLPDGTVEKSPIPLTLAPSIARDIFHYLDIYEATVPGLCLPLSRFRILKEPGAGTGLINLEQLYLPQGTLADALRSHTRSAPNEHWGYLENIIKACLGFVARLLTTRTQFHYGLPGHLVPVYFDPNPANLSVNSNFTKGRVSHVIKNVDVWPAVPIDPMTRMPRLQEDFITFPRNLHEVTIRYYTVFGIIANFIRGLRRIIEVSGDDPATWERIKPVILDHTGMMEVIKRYYLPARSGTFKQEVILELLSIFPLYDISSINMVRELSKMEPLIV